MTVDEKCKIDFTEGCVAKDETLAGNEKCVFSSDYKECKKLKKECSDYTDDDTCGGLGIYESGTKQCTMIDGNCNEFEIDEYCKINTETQECEKRDSITLDEEIESCYLDEYRHTCKKRAKSCSDIKNIQKCSSGRTEDDEAQCLKCGEECAEIIIHPSCKISDDWNSCDSLKTEENKACSFFDGDKTVCWLFEQEEGCKINAENGNCQNAENVPEGKICAYDKDIDDGLFICKIRDIKCKYIKTQALCNSETQIEDNKEFACSWEEYSKDTDEEGCSSFDSDEFCIRKNRECVPKDGVTLAENEKCELSYENGYNTCQKTFAKSCDTYLDKTECNNAPESNKEQCFYEEGYGCVKVKLDGYCHMSEGICKENGSGKLAEDEMCYKTYVGNNEIFCTKKKIECSDISEEEKCNSYNPEIKLCYNLYGDYCFEIKSENECHMDENNKCVGEKCVLDIQKEKCYNPEIVESKVSDSSNVEDKDDSTSDKSKDDEKTQSDKAQNPDSTKNDESGSDNKDENAENSSDINKNEKKDSNDDDGRKENYFGYIKFSQMIFIISMFTL